LIRAATAGRDVMHATIWGLTVAGTLLLFIFVGSNGVKHFDAALMRTG